MTNSPATKASPRSVRPLPPLTAKSAGFAVAVGALSAVLLAIPLAMSHSLVESLLEKSFFCKYFQDYKIDGPKLMVWSWQHNDDLSYLDPAKVGVAYLVGRFVITGEKIAFDRSYSQIKLPVGVYREAAVRLEVRDLDARKTEEIADNLSTMIISRALANPHPLAALQVDFDARLSDREFYSLLLHKLRAKLPASIRLSMTALASWCLGDNWLSAAHLPVDEVVPMIFSLGLGKHEVTQWLVRSNTLSPQLFGGRLAPGLSLNEPRFFGLLGARLSQYNRIYIFSSRGWNRASFQKAQSLFGDDNGVPQGTHDGIGSGAMQSKTFKEIK
jgi:hypothetical protein